MTLTRRAFTVSALFATALPARLRAAPPNASELGLPGMTAVADDVWVAKIDSANWLLSATDSIGGGTIYPANGLVHIGADGPVLVDPGWNAAQGETLIRWWQTTLSHKPTGAILTHFHRDRTGALAALKAARIPAYITPLTHALLGGAPAPAMLPAPFVHAAFGLECYYPGAGHSPDNIVVWDQRSRILFGGCFVKSTTSTALGNLADASVAAWAPSLDRVAARYPAPSLVIPGHGLAQGDAIARTRALLAIGK